MEDGMATPSTAAPPVDRPQWVRVNTRRPRQATGCTPYAFRVLSSTSEQRGESRGSLLGCKERQQQKNKEAKVKNGSVFPV